MTQQNGMMPHRPILAVPVRGTLTGNRGILRIAEGRPGRARRRHRHGSACKPDCGGWQRRVMSPGTRANLLFRAKAVAPAPLPIPLAPLSRPA
jgi:hypothetical protein